MHFFKNMLDSLLVMLILGLVFLDVSKNMGFTEFAGSVQVTLGTDKRLHYVTGVIIALFLFRLLYRVADLKYINTLLVSTTMAITILLADEFSQLLFPNRRFSVNDILAGAFGVLSVFVILFCYKLTKKNQLLMSPRNI